MTARSYPGKATIKRIDSESTVTVWVEIHDSDGFRATSDPQCIVDVVIDQGVLDKRGVLIGCMSGARSARHFFPVGNSTVVIGRVTGCVTETDALGFSMATVAAIARALGREDLLPPGLFQTFLGDWHLCQ